MNFKSLEEPRLPYINSSLITVDTKIKKGRKVEKESHVININVIRRTTTEYLVNKRKVSRKGRQEKRGDST